MSLGIIEPESSIWRILPMTQISRIHGRDRDVETEVETRSVALINLILPKLS